MTASVGIAFTPFEDRVPVIERAAVLAEKRGLDSVGVAEAMTLAAPIVLARLAERTEHIQLATGVLSVWGRSPATLALTAAELQRASSGRFVLGLGSSTAPITEGFHGQSWQAPLYDHPFCLVDHRIQFVSDDGEQNKSPTFQNIFVYLGRDVGKFADVFSRFGYVVRRIER